MGGAESKSPIPVTNFRHEKLLSGLSVSDAAAVANYYCKGSWRLQDRDVRDFFKDWVKVVCTHYATMKNPLRVDLDDMTCYDFDSRSFREALKRHMVTHSQEFAGYVRTHTLSNTKSSSNDYQNLSDKGSLHREEMEALLVHGVKGEFDKFMRPSLGASSEECFGENCFRDE